MNFLNSFCYDHIAVLRPDCAIGYFAAFVRYHERGYFETKTNTMKVLPYSQAVIGSGSGLSNDYASLQL